MGETGIRVVAGVLGLGVTAALAVAVQAGAVTVSGESVLVAGKQTPVAGTESFKGCLDRKLDDSRAHPVTGGSGEFAGAGGFLTKVDTPAKKAPFTETHWEGTIVVTGSPERSLMSSGCG